MECHVRYRIIGRGANEPFSHGKTINMSGNGILLSTDSLLPTGFLVEVEIDWPATLADGVPLKMVVRGKVVRSEKKDVALAGVKILRYTFHTAGAHSSDR
jgi:PilZ domain-containing protein